MQGFAVERLRYFILINIYSIKSFPVQIVFSVLAINFIFSP